MPKKKIILIACASILALVYSFALFKIGMYFGGAEQKAQSNQAATSGRYFVREYNNMIAVFEEGSDAPLRVLDIDIATLRKQDKLRFQEGIVVNSLDELAQLEEDFCS